MAHLWVVGGCICGWWGWEEWIGSRPCIAGAVTPAAISLAQRRPANKKTSTRFLHFCAPCPPFPSARRQREHVKALEAERDRLLAENAALEGLLGTLHSGGERLCCALCGCDVACPAI